MNHAYHFENHRGPLCSGADPRCGGALVPLLHRRALCWLACTVFVLLAACGFFAGLHTGCIAMLVLAFLVSPFGLPAIGEWLLERLYGVKYALQDFMFS